MNKKKYQFVIEVLNTKTRQIKAKYDFKILGRLQNRILLGQKSLDQDYPPMKIQSES